MKLCHVCNFECEKNAELCPICGADLTDTAELDEENCKEVVIEPVLLATIEDVVSAEIFKDILTESKIPYSCSDDENGIKVVFGGGLAAVEIYVDKSYFETAQSLYEEFLSSDIQFDGEFEDIFEEEQ